MSKGAVFLATGFEEMEAINTIDVLRRGGMDIEIVSISGVEYIEGAHGIVVKSDSLFFSIDFSEYELFVLPGGMPGTSNLAKHEGLCELLENANNQGKIIAAICAAPTILAQIGILDGKNATCYPGFEEKCPNTNILNQSVVKDGNILTGKGAGVAIKFAIEILKEFADEKEVDKLQKSLYIGF